MFRCSIIEKFLRFILKFSRLFSFLKHESPSNCPERSEGQFWGQKNEALSKNLEISPIMCFASIQKLTSQNVRISGALVLLLLCPGATICPKVLRFIVVYRFLIVFEMFRKFWLQIFAPRLLKEIRENMKAQAFLNCLLMGMNLFCKRDKARNWMIARDKFKTTDHHCYKFLLIQQNIFFKLYVNQLLIMYKLLHIN